MDENALNIPMKRNSSEVKTNKQTKNKPQLYFVYKKILFTHKNRDRLKVNAWRKKYHANINQKKVVAI